MTNPSPQDPGAYEYPSLDKPAPAAGQPSTPDFPPAQQTSYPPPVAYPQAGYAPQPHGYAPAPEHPQATTIMVLGIISLVSCGLVGPFAWVMGKRALNEIDASGGTIGGRSNVQAGYICGIISTCMLAFALILFILWIVFIVVLFGSIASG